MIIDNICLARNKDVCFSMPWRPCSFWFKTGWAQLDLYLEKVRIGRFVELAVVSTEGYFGRRADKKVIPCCLHLGVVFCGPTRRSFCPCLVCVPCLFVFVGKSKSPTGGPMEFRQGTK